MRCLHLPTCPSCPQDCVDLFELRPPADIGIMSLLDEECMVRGSGLDCRRLSRSLSSCGHCLGT